MQHAHRPSALCADPIVLWEDTKKGVDSIRKASPDKQKLLQHLNIDEQSLEAWYIGGSALPQITTKLRQQIKLYMDKCRSERRGSGDALHQVRQLRVRDICLHHMQKFVACRIFFTDCDFGVS